MDVDPKKLALSLLTGALLGTVFLVCTFTIQVKQLRAGIASETGRQHAAFRDPENVDRYLRSVQKIYATIKAVSPFLSHSRAEKLAPLFKHISDQSGIPIRTCLLIAKVESDFRCVRSGEDYGMMQINQFWLDRYRVTPDHAMEDWNNLILFARIMKELADKPLSYYHSWTPSVRARYERRLEKWASVL
ncbi:MAG: hypothetical protein GTO08_03105 [Deltaproteobacteria bacterium]|nr:hypothetical protein [Deltaproteobacteria bacterium]